METVTRNNYGRLYSYWKSKITHGNDRYTIIPFRKNPPKYFLAFCHFFKISKDRQYLIVTMIQFKGD